MQVYQISGLLYLQGRWYHLLTWFGCKIHCDSCIQIWFGLMCVNTGEMEHGVSEGEGIRRPWSKQRPEFLNKNRRKISAVHLPGTQHHGDFQFVASAGTSFLVNRKYRTCANKQPLEEFRDVRRKYNAHVITCHMYVTCIHKKSMTKKHGHC